MPGVGIVQGGGNQGRNTSICSTHDEEMNWAPKMNFGVDGRILGEEADVLLPTPRATSQSGTKTKQAGE